MKELIQYIAQALVDNPDQVIVQEIEYTLPLYRNFTGRLELLHY